MKFTDDDYRHSYREIMVIASDCEKSTDRNFCANVQYMAESNTIKTGLCGYRNKLASRICTMWSALSIMAAQRVSEIDRRKIRGDVQMSTAIALMLSGRATQ